VQLYPDQDVVVAKLRDAYARGRRAPCLVAPTAFGKAVVASYIIAGTIARGGRPLFIADRCTLLDQLVAKLTAFGVTSVRVIQADRDDGPRDAPVTVASAQTLRMPGWADRLPEATFLIWDESHHVIANTYRALVDRYPHALRLGMTATPCRGDNKPLDLFDELVIGPSTQELIAAGRLAPCQVIAPQPLRPGEIAKTPLDAWRQHAGGRRAAIFRARVSDAQQDVTEFRSAGLRAEAVTAKTRNRANVLARFAAGELDAVASVGVLIEGWDDSGCAVGIVACNPDHIGRWIQICGRMLRYQPGKRALVIDLCGAARKHGHPAEERVYSLDGSGITPTYPRDSIRQCGQCGSVALGRPTVCPYCGWEWPVAPPPRAARVVGAELTEVTVRPYADRIWWRNVPKAKFPGRCLRCGGELLGQPIYSAEGVGNRHQKCPATAALPSAVAPGQGART
jgi:superfamily II DNA or RNA helicase